MKYIIIIAIIVQSAVANASRLAGAILGYFFTTGILLWGLSVYGGGGYISFFGIRLSQSVFFIACLVWYAFNTKEFIQARKQKAAEILTQSESGAQTAVSKASQSSQSPIAQPSNMSGSFIEIKRCYGWGNGTPLLVEVNPNLEEIFSDTNPPNPQRRTDPNPEAWERAELRYKRIPLAIAYLQHPNPQIRKATLDPIHDIDAAVISQVMADMFGDVDMSVRTAVAKAVWQRQGHVHCKYMVNILKDEMDYPGAFLGRDNARKALDLLVQHAPSKEAKDAIKTVINQPI